MKRTKKAIASIAIAGMSLTMIPFNVLAEGAFPTRLGGYTAVQTAVQIAEQTGWTGTAILSSFTSYGMVDALTAGPLATYLKAPILLQGAGNVLDPDTKAELIKLNITKIYVTSGTAVISQAVIDQLKAMNITVESLGGHDRFATSANIAQKMISLGATVTKAAVAYGWLNQDAISIAAIGSAQTEPILLTEKDTIPASVKTFLTTNPSITKTDVIGGTGVISEVVKAQLPNATRVYGYTAYDTNLAVLKAFDSVLKYDYVFIANGETAIDALAGAPLAAKYNAGIVLTKGTANEGTAYVKSKMTSAGVVTALGGTAVVPDVVRSGAVSTVPPVNTGGGGGGPIATSALVSNSAELNNALNNSNITNITFTGDITTPSLTANHSLTIDFGAYVLTGDLTFNHILTGKSFLKGDAGTRINGNLSVDTKNASFENKVIISGGVKIVDVVPGSWTESVNGNTLTITDSNGATINIVGSPGSITVSENADGELALNISSTANITSIVCNAPVKLNVATGAVVKDVNIGAKAGGSTIVNNGTTSNVTVEAAADGTTAITTFTNNGTVTNLNTDAPLKLEANVAPSNTSTGAGGSIDQTGTAAGTFSVFDLTDYITAVNEADAINIIFRLQALADISSLDTDRIDPANAADYVLDFANHPTVTLTQIRARVDAVNAAKIAAKSAIQAAIKNAEDRNPADYTVTSWDAMQPVLTAAKNVSATATITQLNTATTNLMNAINALVLIPKITATSISEAELTDNTLTFSFANLTKSSGITVSKDSKLTLEIGNSGPIGDFILKAGQSNSLLSAPLPTNENLNLTQTNLTAIFEAIKNLEPAEKQAVLNTVDFAKVLELVQDTDLVTQDHVFEAIGFEDFYKAISKADSATKVRILENMTSVIDVALDDVNATNFKLSVVAAMFPLLNEVEPDLSDAQKNALLGFIGNTNLTTLLANLNLSVAQKESILDQMNYTALFEAVMDDLSPATRAEMFKEVNFTDLFTAMKSADAVQKAKITENLVNVMDTIAASNISRVDVLNALVFGANKRDALFQILKNLDGSADSCVTATVTLTDDASNTQTYTFYIYE